MNLIASDQKLDRLQEKAIYEFTLKKQRSKKSTISQKQVAAMQQLATELVSQRKDFNDLLDHNLNEVQETGHRRKNVIACAAQPRPCRCEETEMSLKSLTQPQPHQTTTIKTTTSKCSTKSAYSHTSSTSSDVSLSSSSGTGSASSLNPEHHRFESKRVQTTDVADETLQKGPLPISSVSLLSTISGASTSSLVSDATNIKLSRMRLEQLNNELERRLHQYEYLVAQEKAILGAYKMNLFTSEGVNNFHLFQLDYKSLPYKC